MPPPASKTRGLSPWLYVVLGCGGLVGLGALAVAVFVWFITSKPDAVLAALDDTAEHEARARQILGTPQLPAGYHVVAAQIIPDDFNSAFLSREKPDVNGDVEGGVRHGFMYYRAYSSDLSDPKSAEYLLGQDAAPGPRQLRGLAWDLRVDEHLGRGTLAFEKYTVRYALQRGRLTLLDTRPEGLSALLRVECPGDSQTRQAIWFMPDPAPASPLGAPELSGTPVDAESLRGFLAPFDFCQHP